MKYDYVKRFEDEISDYFGASYGIGTDSCTHAIELCIRYFKPKEITVPTHTYLSVAFLGKKLGIDWKWKEENWKNYYYIGNTNIIDAAVLWKKDSYIPGTFMCLSFQFQKHLNIGRGGMILTDDKKVSKVLKKMSHDGRTPGIPWRNQNIKHFGYHYYMTPEMAKIGLDKLPEAKIRKPRDWKLSDWPDLRNMEIFK